MKPIALEIYVERVNDNQVRPHAFKITRNTYKVNKICVFGVVIGPTETTSTIIVNQEIYGTFNPMALYYSDIYDIIYKEYERVELA